MLPFTHKIAFAIFACVLLVVASREFFRVFRLIRSGARDTDARWNNPLRRVLYALTTTLLQTRTFRKRPWVSFFHSLIFYGFVLYLLVNAVDAWEGYAPVSIEAMGFAGHVYVALADVFSILTIVGVAALVLRRFLLPSRRDFRFNERTRVDPAITAGAITRDSLIVSCFIVFHVGSRVLGSAARVRMERPDAYAPFATALAHFIPAQHAMGFRIFGYWGALGSVLAFLSYFPFSKHLHLIAAPVKYAVARDVASGVLPAMELNLEAEESQLGASRLNELAWPRLLDAYACIQCNRCQDVCPATATGKSLSPSSLEINKRMELNRGESARPLFEFALTPEALWACTTCGACMQACPVQDEPMLDLIDIRRHQVMVEGSFPAPLQSAFRGMERTQNPWGSSPEKRLDWAAGLRVPTTDEIPEPDVLYWVGCAASYDPQSQKTARAMVQLLDHAGINFAVLGKRECCTGDTARRAGNEVLYKQLAETNISTLDTVRPKQIVASCPHCMNAIGKEYGQLGGNYSVVHHTELLAELVSEGKLAAPKDSSRVTFHDPCYLGRHNGVYDAPRQVLTQITSTVVEMPRNRENAFCCGAGGAQFWKEDEPGNERIADNRHREGAEALGNTGTIAVGCPFCKSMLNSSSGSDGVDVRDVAELLWDAIRDKHATPVSAAAVSLERAPAVEIRETPALTTASAAPAPKELSAPEPPRVAARKKWVPKAKPATTAAPEAFAPATKTPEAIAPDVAPRKKWAPRTSAAAATEPSDPAAFDAAAAPSIPTTSSSRKKWAPKAKPEMPVEVRPSVPDAPEPPAPTETAAAPATSPRKKWVPKTKVPDNPDPSDHS